jgi:hypothetical protein
VTSWHRDHARKAIRAALTDRARGRPLPRAPWVAHQVYGPESVELLRQCWAVLDGPTGKRLRPALPELLANLSAHGHLAETDSRAAIDCRLARGLIQLGSADHRQARFLSRR